MGMRSKVFRYAVSVDADGTMRADGGAAAVLPQGWSPDHMVLAALVRCSLNSLRHHAGRAGLDVAGEGDARGVVARREDDGRFAIVEVDVDLVVRLDPAPSPELLRELLEKAERDCFVGASLRARPVYRWTVRADASAPQPVEAAA
jgi:organic hydroperoxide reductase OsmC/OhrA